MTPCKFSIVHLINKTKFIILQKMEKLMEEGITKIYCGHYPYVKETYDKSYITEIN
jgi:hypothetical protein